MKAQLVPMNDREQQGKYDLVPGGNEELFVKDLRSTPLDYDQLRVRGFPLSTFEDKPNFTVAGRQDNSLLGTT